jgi:hypothetical protein
MRIVRPPCPCRQAGRCQAAAGTHMAANPLAASTPMPPL